MLWGCCDGEAIAITRRGRIGQAATADGLTGGALPKGRSAPPYAAAPFNRSLNEQNS
jgi:hypothetical protein